MSADENASGDWARFETGFGGGWTMSYEGVQTDVFDDELGDFPPLVEARAEADRNRRVAAQLARWLDDLDTTGEQSAAYWIQAALDAIDTEGGGPR